MNKTIKLIILTLLISLIAFLSFSKPAQAEVQSKDLCYSQCAAYKFVWQGDYCWDTFQQQCSSGSGKTLQDTIKFLKSIYSVIKSGKNVDTVFKAWFVCKPLIENCIAPQLNQCQQTCQVDQYFYAPDLSVGHPDSRFHGVVYNQNTHELNFKLVNNGRGYAWNIDVAASYGHTPNRNGSIQTGQQLFQEQVEHLIYLGARNGPPKTLTDHITDFLIEESNFSSWLQDLKSDANNYNVPVYWVKTIPFIPIDGELNRIIFNVDPSQLIPESNENNNTYVLDIDLRPTPAKFMINSVSQQLIDQTLNSFAVDFTVKNTGEESGNATAKIYEGKYQNGKTPIYESTQTVAGLSQVDFTATIDINLADELSAYCGKRKKYTIVISDQNNESSSRELTLPLYIGSVRGHVADLFGHRVKGATIKASTGQQTTTNSFGNYYLTGISSPGRISITASKPEFSQPDSQTLDFKYVDEFQACNTGNLTFGSINFVLKDQDVLFTATITDPSGNPINAHLIAANQLFRTEADIAGSGPLNELQPGQYVFTITAPSYKTISQDINAVPNNQDLKFILEPLNGRSDDTSLVITEPQLLWEMDRGSEIYSDMRATKDGNTVIIYTTQNQPNTGKLYFLDSLTGAQRAVVATIANSGESRSAIDTSYDGNTTALCSNDGKLSGRDRGHNWLKLFSAAGELFGELEFNNSLSTERCEVSPDGFFILPNGLTNKGLHVYTDWEVLGHKNNESRVSYGSYRGTIFTPVNTILAGCPEGGGLCTQTINKTVVNQLGNVSGAPVFSDSSQNGAVITTITGNKVYMIGAGGILWEKEVQTKKNSLSTAVSPGGNFVIYSTYTPTSHRTIKIYTADNLDQTPSNVPVNTNADVIYVSANDRGLFYMVANGKKLQYYQVGHYETEYLPETTNTINEEWTTGLSALGWAERFSPIGNKRFADLNTGTIYRADRNIQLAIILPFTQTSLGTLTITQGTLFSVNNQHQPVLLKGQLTANFGSPATVYAIKFDKYNLGEFQIKLNEFIHGLLAVDEYFVINNIHTQFGITNKSNKVEVFVSDGTVSVLVNNQKKLIESGRKITINAANQIHESRYLSVQQKAILIGILIAATGIILFVFRKTAIVKKIHAISLFIGKNILKLCRQLCLGIYQTAKIVFPWAGRKLKTLLLLIIKNIKSKKGGK